MARRSRGRGFQPRAGVAHVPQEPEEVPPFVQDEQTGAAEVPIFVNPAAGLGAHYSQQAAGAFGALGSLQQHRASLEPMNECPDEVLAALDDLEVALGELISRTGKVIGELNEWANTEQE
jgi:hypothetical protein